MHHIFVLFNVHFVVFNQDNGALVVIFSAIVWRAKDGDDGGESLMATPSVHLVAIDLDLMRPNHRYKIVSA